MNIWEIKNIKLLIFGFWLFQLIMRIEYLLKNFLKKLRFPFFIDWIQKLFQN